MITNCKYSKSNHESNSKQYQIKISIRYLKSNNLIYISSFTQLLKLNNKRIFISIILINKNLNLLRGDPLLNHHSAKKLAIISVESKGIGVAYV
ncbi:hypothetical protein BpHYR1_032234 [Brachionus plicatilis]|uniref:Uncharacterized protein n=1 Tax=Brachionus plicatilis TaxID=10195 RepID=A0A3M7T9C9_BRAPC|nr:hypothetical protein BpHYR1_032234 [Brachionus plicatilis]